MEPGQRLPRAHQTPEAAASRFTHKPQSAGAWAVTSPRPKVLLRKEALNQVSLRMPETAHGDHLISRQAASRHVKDLKN